MRRYVICAVYKYTFIHSFIHSFIPAILTLDLLLHYLANLYGYFFPYLNVSSLLANLLASLLIDSGFLKNIYYHLPFIHSFINQIVCSYIRSFVSFSCLFTYKWWGVYCFGWHHSAKDIMIRIFLRTADCAALCWIWHHVDCKIKRADIGRSDIPIAQVMGLTTPAETGQNQEMLVNW